MSSTLAHQRSARGLTTLGVARALEVDRSDGASVTIDRRQVERMGRYLAGRSDFKNLAPAAWDDAMFWNVGDTPSSRSQFFAVGNAVNFRFWRLREGRMEPAGGNIDGTYFRGAMYMWRSLRRSLGRLPVLEAGFLAQLTESDFDSLFADDSGANPLDVGRADRMANLRNLGRELDEHWSGSFYKLLMESNGSLIEFAYRSRRLRAFDDPLYKLTMVNAIMHSGSGVYSFVDRPLPAIDYHLVRHALRQALIRPSAAISAKLKANVLIDQREAYELRRVALSALLSVAELAGIDGEVLDNKYWLNRSNCRDDDPVCLRPETAAQCPFIAACAQETGFGFPLELTRYY